MGSKGQGAKNRLFKKRRGNLAFKHVGVPYFNFCKSKAPKPMVSIYLYFAEMYSCSLFRIENKYSLHLREAMHEVKSSHKI